MEMPGRRSNYTLLSQTPDDYNQSMQFTASHMEPPLSGENNKGNKSEKAFDWDLIQHPTGGRTGTGTGTGIGLQRQSSGSSFGGSSISGEGYMPSAAASDPDFYSHVQDDAFKAGAGGGGSEFFSKSSETRVGGSSSSRTWAQQTEESYQLQLALALRLSSEASRADDPNFLDPVSDEFESRSFALSASLEIISHRFWVRFMFLDDLTILFSVILILLVILMHEYYISYEC